MWVCMWMWIWGVLYSTNLAIYRLDDPTFASTSTSARWRVSHSISLVFFLSFFLKGGVRWALWRIVSASRTVKGLDERSMGFAPSNGDAVFSRTFVPLF